jgi:hypothetical protein
LTLRFDFFIEVVVLIRFSLIVLILCSQASPAQACTGYYIRVVKFVAAVALIHAPFYGISAYQADGARELEKMGGWEWDLIYALMRATNQIIPKPIKASFGKKDYDELYEKIIKVQFSDVLGELIPGISEKLVDEGLIESGDVLAHPLHEAPDWVIKIFLYLGIAIEDYSAYTHWAVYQGSPQLDGEKRKGRVIDFDTRTEPRAPSLEKFLLERAKQGKKYLWILKPLARDLEGMNARVDYVFRNDGTDYRLAHASSNLKDAFKRAFWRGDNCESLSYELATGTAYSEQSAAFRVFTYLFTATAAIGATAIFYHCTRTQRN